MIIDLVLDFVLCFQHFLVLKFRSLTCDFDKDIEEARLYISGLGFYRAYLDGECLNYLHLSVPQTNYFQRVYYDTYDITEIFANSDTHVLAIEVFQKSSSSHLSSWEMAFSIHYL